MRWRVIFHLLKRQDIHFIWNSALIHMILETTRTNMLLGFWLFSLWYQYRLTDIYFIFLDLIQHYLFSCSNFFCFDHWELFHLAFWSFWYMFIIMHLFICLEYFITFWNYKILQIILYISCPIFRISCFFQEMLVPFLEKIY